MPTGSEIMERAGILLQDEEHTRWPLTELATWINGGVDAILLAKPSAKSGTIIQQLKKGTHQTVPTTGTPTPLRILGVTRNLRSNATDPRIGGRAIRPTSRAHLDAQEPNWHDERYVRFRPEVRHIVFDEENPLEFYCYPGNDGKGYVEILVSQRPAKLTADGTDTQIASYGADLGLPELYSEPLVDYVCYRAQSKDDLDGNTGRAAVHFQQFATALGIKIQTERATSPNRQRAE